MENQLKEKIGDMKETLNEVEVDVNKFVAGNKSAGTRVRVELQKIKGLAQECRALISNIRNQGK